jgi:hypothetical protein
VGWGNVEQSRINSQEKWQHDQAPCQTT